jgi:hypothetical protein
MELMADPPDGLSTFGRFLVVYVVAIAAAVGLMIGLQTYYGIEADRTFLTLVALYNLWLLWKKPRWAWEWAIFRLWRELLGDRGAVVFWGIVSVVLLYLGLFTRVRVPR